MRLILQILFSTFMLLPGFTAQAQQCIEIFQRATLSPDMAKIAKSSPRVAEFFAKDQYFEASLILRKQGDVESAVKIDEFIEAELMKVDGTEINLSRAGRLGSNRGGGLFGSNLHNTYIIQSGRVRGVWKAGITPFLHERIAYVFAKHFGFPVPVTVAVTINGKTGSFQYFLANSKNAKESDRKSDSNVTTNTFDALFANWDRSQKNYLLFTELGKSQTHLIQVLIDNEMILPTRKELNSGDMVYPSVTRSMVADLKRDNPELAEHLADPKREELFLKDIAELLVEGGRYAPDISILRDRLREYRELYSSLWN